MARVGIVGTGWGARVQAPLFREAGLEVVDVVGRDGWRALLERDIDVVVITMPPSVHAEMAVAALEAGKHVICEKPTALNVAEAERMADAADGRPSQLALIDHELRFVPAWRAVRERFGEIGPVRYVELRYASPSRGDRSRAWTWWSDAKHGGGILGAVGSHYIDALRAFGLEVEGVQATLHTVIKERSSKPVTSDDLAALHLRLRGGALALFTLSAVSSGPDEATTMTIHGETGAFRISGEEAMLGGPKVPFTRVAGGPLAERPGNSPGGAFGTGTLHFARALRAALDDGDRGALAPAATFRDGLAVQRVLDAARAGSPDV